MTGPFVHLHDHPDYSLLDGACALDRLVAKAKANGMPAVALTDHGNLFGAVQFYQQAKNAGLKPIIGCEVYVVPGSRFDQKKQEETRFHLILLARDAEGYANLCRLSSLGYLEGFYYKPRVDFELLRKHSAGLVALSACLQGEIPICLNLDDDDGAAAAARRYAEIFGPDNFYLELQDHGLPEQRKVNEKLIALARRTGLPLVATNDCHYMDAQDARAHEVLVCIQTGKLLSDEDRMAFESGEFYFKTAEEMAQLFGAVPEALENTVRIAERCHFEFDLHSQYYPRFDIPEEETLEEYLERVVREGFEWRKQAIFTPDGTARRTSHTLAEYEQRLEFELEVIKRQKYASYFLIVWDFIRKAREMGIPVGPGRGSAAGSLVAYCLRITDLDPLLYNLLFERFLNPERISPPDIDIDFCGRRREEVIRYVTEKYGQDCVCQIATFGTLKARAALKDVARVLNIPYSDVDRIAKLVPEGPNVTLDKALAEEPQLKETIDSLAEKNGEVRHLIDISRRLEGLSRHTSIHAAGVVIAPRPLIDIVPLARGKEEEVVTQYNMKDIEKLGFLKMDFLGLITLTVIHDALELIRSARGFDLDIDHIPLDDAKTYQLFAEGRTVGIFQFESAGMRKYLQMLKPTRIEDLIAMNALYRPGPIKGGMVDDFIRRKNGQLATTYAIPQLEAILKDTYGVIAYQEQVMQISQKLAGFTQGEADTLRKAMGKKLVEVMDKMGEKFIAGCVARQIEPAKAKQHYESMRGFGEYGFNKSHSAAYAWLAYQTAYLKANYPEEYMSALLTSEIDDTDKVVKYISETRSMKIQVLPPSINESELDFRPTARGIRFGLGALKNVGESAIQTILNARRTGGSFRSFQDFCNRVDMRSVNSRVLESMIKAGVFDELGYRRSQLMEELNRFMESAQKFQRNRAIGQRSLFGDEAEEAGAGERERLPDIPEWDTRKILSCEKEIMGFYISGHPLDEFAEIIQKYTDTTIDQLADESVGRTFRIGCVLGDLKFKRTFKTRESMCSGFMEDLTGAVDFVVFPKVLEKVEPLLKLDTPLLVFGVCDQDENKKLKIRVNEVRPLAEARDFKVAAIRLELDIQRLNQLAMRELTEILLTNPGECGVEILMRKGDAGVAWMAANEFLRVNWSAQLKYRIEEAAYPGCVHYLA